MSWCAGGWGGGPGWGGRKYMYTNVIRQYILQREGRREIVYKVCKVEKFKIKKIICKRCLGFESWLSYRKKRKKFLSLICIVTLKHYIFFLLSEISFDKTRVINSSNTKNLDDKSSSDRKFSLSLSLSLYSFFMYFFFFFGYQFQQRRKNLSV